MVDKKIKKEILIRWVFVLFFFMVFLMCSVALKVILEEYFWVYGITLVSGGMMPVIIASICELSKI